MKIVKYPNNVLVKKSEPVTTVDDELREFVIELYQLMVDNNGVGIAAPQVGKNIRLFIFPAKSIGNYQCAINPAITSVSDRKILAPEGCLSFPDLNVDIKRHASIEVRYADLDGEYITETLHGIRARCFQHEMDHLNGIVHLDRLSKTRKRVALRKWRKKRKLKTR